MQEESACKLARLESDSQAPGGQFESDPNLTDKKFPGNPTRSYRSSLTLLMIGEVSDWERQKPEVIQAYREKLENNKGEIIN